MKQSKVYYILFMVIVIYLLPLTVEAKSSYTISSPNIQENRRKVTIEWNQTQAVLVTVYKLSYVRKLSNNCSGVETLGASCVMLWQKRGILGTIRVIDKGYRKGDEYYIQQNVYQTHNGGYGPFIPK